MIAQCNGTIEVCSPFDDIAGPHQRYAHKAMSPDQRDDRPLLLSEGQEPCGQFAKRVTIEGDMIREPEAVEDQQLLWIADRRTDAPDASSKRPLVRGSPVGSCGGSK